MKLEDISKAQYLATQLKEYETALERLRAIDPSGKGQFVFRYKGYEREITCLNQLFVTTSISAYFDKEINRIIQEIDAL